MRRLLLASPRQVELGRAGAWPTSTGRWRPRGLRAAPPWRGTWSPGLAPRSGARARHAERVLQTWQLMAPILGTWTRRSRRLRSIYLAAPEPACWRPCSARAGEVASLMHDRPQSGPRPTGGGPLPAEPEQGVRRRARQVPDRGAGGDRVRGRGLARAGAGQRSAGRVRAAEGPGAEAAARRCGSDRGRDDLARDPAARLWRRRRHALFRPGARSCFPAPGCPASPWTARWRRSGCS